VIGYIVRRIGASVVVLVGVSVFIFALLHVIYPSPAIDVLGSRANSALIAAWNKQYGFDDPWLVQYLRYMGNLLHGNLGYSYKLNQSVSALFGEVWARSAWLSGASLVLAVVIAIPLGVYQAVRRNSIGDYVATSLAFSVYAMPVFLLGLILIQVFALDLHWFSFEASQSSSLLAIITDRS
jgi:peptide/nickel transport system permease protein